MRRALATLAALGLSSSAFAQQFTQGQTSAPPLPPKAPTALGLFQEQDLFVSGALGVPTFRAPALCATDSGVLLAVCDARSNGAAELPGDIDMVLRRSTDRGVTWEPESTIQDPAAGQGASGASLLVERTTGRVFCCFTYGPPGIGWSNSQAGSSSSSDPSTLHARIIWSDDDGLTWSLPIDLNPQVKSTAWRALRPSSGSGIQTRAGRLLQPLVVLGAAGTSHARNIYSDDLGLSWRAGERIANGVTESEAAETSADSIVQNLRHEIEPARFIAVSHDGGVTHDPLYQHPALVDPNANAGLLVHSAVASGAARDIWLFSNPPNTTGLAHVSVALSYDEGLSFHASRVVHYGPSGSSTLARLGDGTVGMLYERGLAGPYEAVTFARFDLRWLLEHQSPLRPSGMPRPDHPALWAWYDAGHEATLNGAGPDLDGASVTRWDDRGANGAHHLVRTSNAPPSLALAGANGQAAVSFDGGADLWGAASAAGEFETPSPGVTLLFTARVDAVSATGYLFDRASSAGGVGLRVAPGSAPRYELHVARMTKGPPLNLAFSSAPVALGSLELHSITLAADQVEHRIDGVVASDVFFANGGLPLVQAGLTLGSKSGGSAGFEGALAEILVYDTALSDDDRAAVEGYLRAKYGL